MVLGLIEYLVDQFEYLVVLGLVEYLVVPGLVLRLVEYLVVMCSYNTIMACELVQHNITI